MIRYPHSYFEMRRAAQRELLRRKRTYPVRIASHRYTPGKAAYEIDVMAAIIDVLRELEKTEQLI